MKLTLTKKWGGVPLPSADPIRIGIPHEHRDRGISRELSLINKLRSERGAAHTMLTSSELE